MYLPEKKKSLLLHVHLHRKALLVSTKFPCVRTTAQHLSSPLWMSLKWGYGWTVQCTFKLITLGFTFFIDFTPLSHSVGTGTKTKFQRKSWPRLEAWPRVRKSLATAMVEGEGWARVPGNGSSHFPERSQNEVATFRFDFVIWSLYRHLILFPDKTWLALNSNEYPTDVIFTRETQLFRAENRICFKWTILSKHRRSPSNHTIFFSWKCPHFHSFSW